MPQILMAILIYALPLLVLALPFVLICSMKLKQFHSDKQNRSAQPQSILPDETDFSALEEKLNILIKNNKIAFKAEKLRQELAKTPSHIIASYLNLNRQKLKGLFLFRLIFDLIKNNTDTHKIIRIMRHYLPSCSTSHLYALLRSCKEFLNLNHSEVPSKDLVTELKNNHLQQSLIYMQEKISETLNQIPEASTSLQQSLIEKTTVYGLIFAAICEFYNTEITEKMLSFSYRLSPETFEYWHSVPHQPHIKRKKITPISFSVPDETNQRPQLSRQQNPIQRQ